MKLFKTIDSIAQVFLVTSWLIFLTYFYFNRNAFSEDVLFTSYFIVGGAQIFSMLVNFIIEGQYKISGRKIYHALLIITAGVGLVSFLGDNMIYYAFGILFWSPVLAVFYCAVCATEANKLWRYENILPAL